MFMPLKKQSMKTKGILLSVKEDLVLNSDDLTMSSVPINSSNSLSLDVLLLIVTLTNLLLKKLE